MASWWLPDDVSFVDTLPMTATGKIHKVTLRFHHRIDGLVRHRSFVDDVRVLTAFDARGRLHVIFHREATLRFATRHGTSRSMTAAHETFRIALATHDV